ncbi:putative ribonuclease H-like domain-containing protein [Tanacetum coccineum]|uniref:Ribonuclease H-like domain-containing protein n=1 Tax=Tanacetum coccineum TaxID=301880 RepID=A0ABQ5DEQ1_9ASTR
MTHPYPKGNFVPKAVLMKSGVKTLNTAGQNFSKAAILVNTARPINTAYPRPTVNSARTTSNVFNREHTHVRRPFNKFTTNKNINLKEQVNTIKENVTTAGPKVVVCDNKGNEANAVKAPTCWVWRPKQKVLDIGNPQLELQEKGVINNGCSRHMTGNKSYLSYYEEIDGGFVAFGGDPKGGRITGKGKISTGKLDFEDLYFVKELKFNLFSVSQMCDKKNSILFTDTECVVLSPDFKLLDENHVLLRVLRKDNMYSVDLKNIVPSGGLTCLFVKATLDESRLWHRRLRHINIKTLNKLVRGNLVRGLPSKIFENNHTCVACQKGKQHKASCIENLIDLKMKVIRCDNRTEFKNKVMNQLCEMKGIKREFSVARTPQKNRVAERKNRKLIEAARTMLADLKLPTTFWAEIYLGKFDGKGDEGFFVGYSTNSKTYKPVVAGNQTNGNAGTKENIDAGQDGKKIVPDQKEEEKMESEHPENKDNEVPNTEEPRVNQKQDANVNSTNNINTVSLTVNAVDIENNAVDENIVYRCINDPNMPNLEEIVYSDDDEEVGAEADMNNLATNVPNVTEHVEPKKVTQDLTDPSWIEAMQDELLQFKLQKVWTLVELPYGKRTIGTKWVYINKKDDRGIVVRNKARLVAQGYTQEEGIYYDEVFTPVARIKEIRLFLAYASFMNFIVYQMDVKSAFLYGTIEEEVYVCQPPGFEDPEFPNKVYKVEKALYGLHQAPRAWYETLSTYLLENGFRRGTIDKTLFIKKDKGDILLVQVKQKDDGIFISQDKYVADILKKFDFATVKTASTPMETNKALLKDEEAADVDVHLYRSMIGSLMYLTASRPDIMFAVCACARFQVTPKTSHLHAVKRIFRYLKGHPKLGLWYPRDSPFDLEAFSDSDYTGTSLDRKSTTGGCQFLRKRLILWQCKKQTIVANSTTEAEYVAAANCRG